MKASIEFSARQVIILILMILIAVMVIYLGISQSNRIKDLFMGLLQSGEAVVG